MKHIRIFVTFVLMTVLTSAAVAQMVSPVDFMRNNPRNVMANPAVYTAEYGYFDMALGGINVGVLHPGIKYDKFFRFGTDGRPVAIDLDKGVASLRSKNYINSYVNYDLFNCGRRTKHGYFTFSYRIREQESIRFKKDLMQLFANGNAAYLGESNPANIGMSVAARAYQELAAGFQVSLTEQWNVGLRLKFLMGFADAKTTTMNATLVTDPDTYALSLTADAAVRAALPYKFIMKDGMPTPEDSRFNVSNLFKNYGLGLDLGGEYAIDDQWGVAAAITDIGFIRWNNIPVKFVGGIADGGQYYHNGAVEFSGLTTEQVNGLMDGSITVNSIMDTVMNYVQLAPEDIKGYTTGLNATLMARGYYDLTPEHRFSAQLMGCNMGLGLMPAMTLAYTGSFADRYDVVATYTMMPGSYDNIGIGLSANLGGALIYVATNNFFGLFNPANRSQINAQFGLSFTSGQLIKRSETIILRDQAASESSLVE